MPWAAPRFCSKPGHPPFTGRRCPECARAWSQAAGSSSARGYGSAWQRLRRAVLAAEPNCRTHAARGQTVPATEVDHIQPVALRPDLRLERSNLQPLCRACHQAITKAFNTGRRAAAASQGDRGVRFRADGTSDRTGGLSYTHGANGRFAGNGSAPPPAQADRIASQVDRGGQSARRSISGRLPPQSVSPDKNEV